MAVHAKLAPKERENVPEMSDKSPTVPTNQKKSQKNQNYEKTRHKTSLTLIIFDLQNDLRLKLNLRSGFSGRSKNAISRLLKHFCRDTCTWKEQLEIARCWKVLTWKVLTWKVCSWKVSLKLERSKRSWKEPIEVGKFELKLESSG